MLPNLTIGHLATLLHPPQTRYLAGVVFLVRRRRCGPGNVIQDEDALRRLEEVRGLGGRPP